jgi:type II secretory pathway pseudopilin PulG
MRPDPARSRVEGRTRLAGRSAGYSLLEGLFVAGLLVTLGGVSVPLILSSLDASRTQGAARYLAGRLNLARMEAVKRSTYVALRIEGPQSAYRYTFYADGNRNGVRLAEIGRNVDRPIGLPERLDEKFPGVAFGILDGVGAIDESEPLGAGSDPIRFGRSDLISFSPVGSATAGTFYIRGRGKQQMAVRVLGTTGRIRVLRFDFRTREWVRQ